MLLTASRSRREGGAARRWTSAWKSRLGTATGAAGAGGSGRRRPPVSAAATMAAPLSGPRSLRASRGLDRMVLGFRGRGGGGALLALLRLDAGGAEGLRGVRAGRQRGHGFARRRRRDRRLRGVGSRGGRAFRWSRGRGKRSPLAQSSGKAAIAARASICRPVDASRSSAGSSASGCESSTGSPVNAAIWSAGLTRRSGARRGGGRREPGRPWRWGPLIGEIRSGVS